MSEKKDKPEFVWRFPEILERGCVIGKSGPTPEVSRRRRGSGECKYAREQRALPAGGSKETRRKAGAGNGGGELRFVRVGIKLKTLSRGSLSCLKLPEFRRKKKKPRKLQEEGQRSVTLILRMPRKVREISKN